MRLKEKLQPALQTFRPIPARGDVTLAMSGKFLLGLVALKSVSHNPVTNQRLNLSERRGRRWTGLPGSSQKLRMAIYWLESGTCIFLAAPRGESVSRWRHRESAEHQMLWLSEQDKLGLAHACLTSAHPLPVGKPHTQSVYDPKVALRARKQKQNYSKECSVSERASGTQPGRSWS